MMNNKVTRLIANTVGLAAVAALGITVYQLGTSPIKETPQQEQSSDLEEEDLQDGSAVDVGADRIDSEDGSSMQENETQSGEDLLTSTDFDENTNEDLESYNKNSDAQEKEEGSTVTDEMTTEYDNVVSEDETEQTAGDEIYEETADASAMAVNLPAVNFSEDTLMEWPVNGNILLDYSMDQSTYFPTLDQYKLSSAISVGAVEGAPVVAAVNGTVYSVKQDPQTGTTLTMELGNGYQAIYGQLTDLAVSEGETVQKGTIIGYIAQPTKYYSTEGTNLYFAMKKDGEPIDPIAYLP